MRLHAIRRAALLLLTSTITAACGDSTAPPPEIVPTTGTITLNVATTGVDLDADGFLLSVDGAPQQTIPVNGVVIWTGAEGSHSIAITGLAFNCDLIAAPASTSVTLGQTTRLDVRASCGPYLRNAIVYTSEASGLPEVMVMRADGSRRERLTTDGAVYAMPVVSPDGQSIAVASRVGGSWSGIYLLDRFGKSRTRLVGRSTFDGSPAWSPDGTRLAFRSMIAGPYGDYGRIWIVNRDGTGLRQLTPETPGYTFDDGPTWSPDGTQLAYSHEGVLTVIDVDGSTSPTSLGVGAEYPAWSPDGLQIAFSSSGGGASGILVADAHGGNVRQLTTPAEGDQYPRWSPDGRQIIFQRVEGGVFHLYRMAADGTGQTRLDTETASESGASWSPSF